MDFVDTMKNKIDWNKRHVIWIRTGKVGSSSFHHAFAGKSPGNDFIEHNKITTLPKYGKIIEVHSKNVGYAKGILEFKKKYPEIWENAYKVLIVRNPYDRFVSAWKFLARTKNMGFDDLINFDFNKLTESVNYHIIRPLTEDLIIDDKLNVDHIIRFENFQSDFNNFCDVISYPRRKLNHIRKGNHNNYKEYYNQKRADFVYELMKNDFNLLCYDKESWKL